MSSPAYVTGNLTRNPQLSRTTDATPVVNLTIAENSRRLLAGTGAGRYGDDQHPVRTRHQPRRGAQRAVADRSEQPRHHRAGPRGCSPTAAASAWTRRSIGYAATRDHNLKLGAVGRQIIESDLAAAVLAGPPLPQDHTATAVTRTRSAALVSSPDRSPFADPSASALSGAWVKGHRGVLRVGMAHARLDRCR